MAVGHCIHLHKWGWEFGAKNPKLNCYSSVSGMPTETVVEENRERWLGGVYVVAAVLHSLMEVGAGVWGQKSKTELPWLGFQSTMSNRGGRRWWSGLYKAMAVMGWCICTHEVGEGVEVPKTQNQATEAQF